MYFFFVASVFVKLLKVLYLLMANKIMFCSVCIDDFITFFRLLDNVSSDNRTYKIRFTLSGKKQISAFQRL